MAREQDRSLEIAYEAEARLPPLAWCLHAKAGAAVRVRHGPGVEVRPEGFVEGA